jgi:hypothetical protein
MPRVSSLHHPSSGLPTLVARQTLVSSTSRRDMPGIALQHRHPMCRSVVISCIQTQMMWLSGARTWSHHSTVIDQLLQHRPIINIGGRDTHAERNSPAIDQKVVLHPRFTAISRVRAALFSPPAARARKSRHHFATPTRLNASHRRGGDTWHGFVQRLRHFSIRRSGRRRFARGRTLVARHATGSLPTTGRGWHRGSSDQRCAGARHARVGVWAGGGIRFPPTTYQELGGVFSFRYFTKLLRFADTL